MIHDLILDDFNIKYIFLDDNFKNKLNLNLKQYCNNFDLKKINFYDKFEDKLRCLGSIILQKSLFKKNPKKLIIKKNRNGKPFIDEKLKYNVSHDTEIVIITWGKKEIGIDIVSKNNKYLKNFDIKKSNENLNNFELWSLLEAYYKYLGLGLVNIENRKIRFLKNNNKIFCNIKNIKIFHKEIIINQKVFYLSIITADLN